MQKKNLLKAICVALVAISFSCAEATTEKTGSDTTPPVTIDTNVARSAAPIDTAKKDTDRNVRPLPPPPPPTNNQ